MRKFFLRSLRGIYADFTQILRMLTQFYAEFTQNLRRKVYPIEFTQILRSLLRIYASKFTHVNIIYALYMNLQSLRMLYRITRSFCNFSNGKRA